MPQKPAQEVITFKADESLLHAMKGIRNRSEFIRAAILSALDSICPVCMGTGVLTECQREHWESFERSHKIEQCEKCSSVHLVCASGKGGKKR
jgi:hypothetical protein